MESKTKFYFRCSLWSLLCTVIIFLITVKPSTAQDNLIPGYWGSTGNYELALKTVFMEAYNRETRLRVQIQSKYGTENMTGVRSDSTGYYLFYLIPENSVWNSSWVDVPCRDSDGKILPESEKRSCSQLDFSSVDTLQVNRYQTAIDSSLAQNLISLWGEMLVRSSYRQKRLTVSTGGTTYQYSAFKFGLGNIQGYSSNPKEGSYTGDLAAISRLMRNASRAESKANSDSLLSQIDIKADSLLGKLLSFGDVVPSRTHINRTLKGCDSTYRNVVENIYCWQAYLTDDEIPNLIIANKNTGDYFFELVDLSDLTDISKVQIIPVMSIHNLFNSDENPFGWNDFLLEPWDIVDLTTNTRNNEFQIFGYKEFTIENEQLKYSPDSIIIKFDGLFSNRDKRVRLDIDGDHGWFSIRDIFKGH